MKKFFAGIFAITTIMLSVIVPVTRRQQLTDWYILQTYEPTSQIADLAAVTTMTEYGRRLFYLNKPEIIPDKVSFTAKCNQMEQSIVLGCYISRDGIYLYKVTDNRLQGVNEVTAAHEMLHVGYERLTNKEKNRINALLLSEYKKITDKRVIDTIKAYQEKDPNIVLNELHSILPTEVRSLSVELNDYYKKYFIDRTKVTDLSAKYENEFVGREQNIEKYDQDLKSKKQQINSNLKQIDLLASSLSIEKARMDNYRKAGDVVAYNNTVPTFNQIVNEYNSLVKITQAQIDSYNALVENRNSLAGDIRSLVDSIDSRPQIQN